MKNYLANFRFPLKKEFIDPHEDHRQESLELALPRLSIKPKGFETHAGRLKERLTNYSREKTQLIQEGIKYLEQINKYELKPPLRLTLSQIILENSASHLTDLYRKYVAKGTSFPESPERKTDLNACINLIHNLLLSYKILLAHDYTLPLKKFNQQHERVRFTCIKILELIMWLQRFQAIRFQKLSAQDWKEFNTIFFIYASIFDINELNDMTDSLVIFKATGVFSDNSPRRSVKSLYLSVQLFGMLDITSWPSQSIVSIEQYLDKQEDLLDFHLGKPKAEFEDFIITYANADSPPLFEARETSFNCCYINLAKLKRQIKRELEEIERKKFIGEEDKKRLQPQGKIDALSDNQGLLTLLIKNLSDVTRVKERKSLYGSRAVQVYSGLAESYRLLYELGRQSKNKEKEDTGFRDAAARHSSLLVDDPSGEIECQWLIMNESDSGLLIRTIETKYMHSMEVGHVVAIRHEEEDKNSFPQLGYITRLDRLRDGELDVAIVKISVLAEAVTILEPGQDQNNQDLLPGILVKGLHDEWQLILPRYVSYVSGTPAIIRRKEDNIPVRLGDVVDTKNGFTMFVVRSPGLK